MLDLVNSFICCLCLMVSRVLIGCMLVFSICLIGVCCNGLNGGVISVLVFVVLGEGRLLSGLLLLFRM